MTSPAPFLSRQFGEYLLVAQLSEDSLGIVYRALYAADERRFVRLRIIESERTFSRRDRAGHPRERGARASRARRDRLASTARHRRRRPLPDVGRDRRLDARHDARARARARHPHSGRVRPPRGGAHRRRPRACVSRGARRPADSARPALARVRLDLSRRGGARGRLRHGRRRPALAALAEAPRGDRPLHRARGPGRGNRGRELRRVLARRHPDGASDRATALARRAQRRAAGGGCPLRRARVLSPQVPGLGRRALRVRRRRAPGPPAAGHGQPVLALHGEPRPLSVQAAQSREPEHGSVVGSGIHEPGRRARRAARPLPTTRRSRRRLSRERPGGVVATRPRRRTRPFRSCSKRSRRRCPPCRRPLPRSLPRRRSKDTEIASRKRAPMRSRRCRLSPARGLGRPRRSRRPRRWPSAVFSSRARFTRSAAPPRPNNSRPPPDGWPSKPRRRPPGLPTRRSASWRRPRRRAPPRLRPAPAAPARPAARAAGVRTAPKVRKELRQPAEDLRLRAALARIEADRVNASETASAIFGEGRSSEKEGERLLRERDYQAAQLAFSRAARLFQQARELTWEERVRQSELAPAK